MAMAAAARAAASRTPSRATTAARLVQSRLRSSTTRVLAEEENAAAEKLSREEIGREIQEKKEALYDVIAKAEQRFDTRSFQNLRLQQILSVQVNPRPWDSEWRHMRFARRVNGAMEFAGFIALGVLADYGWKQYKARREEREQLLRAMMIEEEEKAGEAN